VYQLIREEGFDQFYALKDKTVVAPVGTSVFEELNESELKQRWETAEILGRGSRRQSFALRGISCIGCVWLIEKLFYKQDAATRIEINPNRGTLAIEATEHFDIQQFASDIQRFGYIIDPKIGRFEKGESSLAASKIGVCGFLAMNSMAFTLPFYLGMDPQDDLAPLLRFIVVILASFSVLFGGTFFFKRAWTALRLGTLHIDLPIALGISVAYVGSCIGWALGDHELFYFDFIAIFILLMLVGRWLQERITDRNLKASAEGRPYDDSVDSLDDAGTIHKIALSDIEEGTEYQLNSGNWIPVMSQVNGSKIEVSLESINGESEPKVYQSGEAVPAGALLISSGSGQFLAMETWDHSLLKRLSEVENTVALRGDLMERILKYYILAVIGFACVGFTIWSIAWGEWVKAIQVAVSVLVVSCPCAIGLAYPMVQELCSGWLKSRGVFLRDNSMWSRLKRVRDVFFDKTGTLTMETRKLINPEVLESLDRPFLEVLYALVVQNLHPVGRSLKTYLLLLHPDLGSNRLVDSEVKELLGFGVELNIDGRKYWLKKSGDGAGKSEFGYDSSLLATFMFEDWVREEVKESIDWLKQHGKQVHLISGDAAEKVEHMAAMLGIDPKLSSGNMSPQDKAEWIEARAKSSGMMVGDGANDAIAFESAICRATPVVGRGVLEQHSDFFFLGYGIRGITDVFSLSVRRSRVVREVLTMTITYNFLAICLSLSGWMNPLLAAILMPLSSIVTVSWTTLRLSKKVLDRHSAVSV
jgi:Cu2+-exporting ATPase